MASGKDVVLERLGEELLVHDPVTNRAFVLAEPAAWLVESGAVGSSRALAVSATKALSRVITVEAIDDARSQLAVHGLVARRTSRRRMLAVSAAVLVTAIVVPNVADAASCSNVCNGTNRGAACTRFFGGCGTCNVAGFCS